MSSSSASETRSGEAPPARVARGVSLVGFMGSGKSTVGRRLARQLKLPFVDLDQRIESAAGSDIESLFSGEGEASFRAWEGRVLREVLDEEPCVLATGGGAVMDEDNRQRLRAYGPVIWLDSRFETVRGRLLASQSTVRPLVVELGWSGLARLHSSRRPAYAASAHLRLDADARTPRELARGIAEALNSWSPPSPSRGEES